MGRDRARQRWTKVRNHFHLEKPINITKIKTLTPTQKEVLKKKIKKGLAKGCELGWQGVKHLASKAKEFVIGNGVNAVLTTAFVCGLGQMGFACGPDEVQSLLTTMVCPLIGL